MIRIAIISLAVAMAAGCASTNDPEVFTTKQWEGRYGTVEEFKEKTEDIELGKGESVWVLSNGTLKRLLKSTGK